MPKYTSLSEIQTALKTGEADIADIVSHYLTQVEATKDLNAYVEVFAEEALQKAQELDAKFRANPASVGRLFGMVLSIKDVLCYKDHQVTAGSKILEGFTSLFSATAVERLLAEDCIIIGRTNCDEFAMGSTNENSHYGPAKNAADTSKVQVGLQEAQQCRCRQILVWRRWVRIQAALCGSRQRFVGSLA